MADEESRKRIAKAISEARARDIEKLESYRRRATAADRENLRIFRKRRALLNEELRIAMSASRKKKP